MSHWQWHLMISFFFLFRVGDNPWTMQQALLMLYDRTRAYNAIVADTAVIRGRLERGRGELCALRGEWASLRAAAAPWGAQPGAGAALPPARDLCSEERQMRARYQELQAQLLSREAALREQAFQRQQYAFMRARLDTNLEALARYLAATEEALKCVACELK